MKIISWNVNGIRAVAKKGFKEFVEAELPDILCIQETKAFEDQFLKDVGELEGYNYIWHAGERAGYAGTAIFYKKELEVVNMNNHFDKIEHFHTDGRVTEVEFKYTTKPLPCPQDSPTRGSILSPSQEKEATKSIVLFNGYIPNGGTRADGTEMVDYKLDFYDHLIDYTRKLKKEGKNFILTGDFNICHEEIDIARPKQNINSIGFLPVERQKIGELINDGNIDVWRYLNPNKLDVYSWWSYRAGARPNNVGWRIDYFIINKDLIEDINNIEYMTDVMGSDHCPILLELK